MLSFLQTESKALHQQKYYGLFYLDTRFIAVVWNPTRNLSEVCF